MAVRIFSLNTAQPKVEYRTIIDYFKNEQVAEYELDFGTGELTMQLNDEKKTTITYMCRISACFCRIPMIPGRTVQRRAPRCPHQAVL